MAWGESRPEPECRRERMTLRLSEREWEEIAAIKGDRSLSDTVREVVAVGLATLTYRSRGVRT
jgi:hypothetical protein